MVPDSAVHVAESRPDRRHPHAYAWKRLALVYAILLRPIAVLVFVGIMVLEADYTLSTRELLFK